MPKTLTIIYASTSGHTEYAIDVLVEHLKKKMRSAKVDVLRAEACDAKDFSKGDMLLMASGTWNTGGVEGQMNPHMHMLVHKRAKDVDLKKKPVVIVATGDDRYFYTCRAGAHMQGFAAKHNGKLINPSLSIVNEPYGQEKKITDWAEKVLIPTLKQL